MKRILTGVQDLIRIKLTYVRKVDVYITSHENFIPKGTKFPAVGIKDGRVRRTRIPGGVSDWIRSVKLIPYVKSYDGEKTILGGGSVKGILDITTDLHAALGDDFLGIPGVEDAYCEEEKESENFGVPGDGLQRKIIIYNYEVRE